MKFYFGPKTQQTRKPIQKIKYIYMFLLNFMLVNVKSYYRYMLQKINKNALLGFQPSL